MMRSVKEALDDYAARYDAPNHQQKSIAWVKERIPHLKRLLGKLSLLDLAESRITGYMRTRSTEGASNRTVNMELCVLARAIGRPFGQLWPNVPKLDERTDIGRALLPAEEGRLLAAASKNKSKYIYPFVRIALLTGMREGEIRTLQFARLDLNSKLLRVGRSKTPAGRGRGIPMNAELFSTIKGQADWIGENFGEPEPDWYLFPFSNRVRPIDPKRPVTTMKTAWESVRTAAKVSCRFHDLRHTAATKMAENDVPEATMKALLGHMSKAMLERYSHIRNEAKRKATDSPTLATPIFEVPQESPQVTQKRKLKVVGK